MEDNRQWKPQRKALLEKIGGRVVKQQFEKKDADGKTISEEKESLEDGVLAWGRENDRSMDEFWAMVREFYGDKAPKIMDPFAGGGAIPLEAMRLGCDVTASDLNPVAWFILRFTPPAQLNVFDFLFNRGGMPARSCLGARSVRIGEDSFNLLNRGDVIPLGFTPCNACPVEFPHSSGTPLGIQQGGHIPLGLYCSKKRFSKKLH